MIRFCFGYFPGISEDKKFTFTFEIYWHIRLEFLEEFFYTETKQSTEKEQEVFSMKDDNCIFCKLANKDIPTNIIYEDDRFTVILDASPATKGHALILPKNHAANIYELPDEDASSVFVLAKNWQQR